MLDRENRATRQQLQMLHAAPGLSHHEGKDRCVCDVTSWGPRYTVI